MKRKIIYLAKEQRKLAKAVKSQMDGYMDLLKKADVKPYDNLQTTNDKILDYISNLRYGFNKIKLSSDQTNDPNFMEKLYNANPIMTEYYPVDPENFEHQKNANLMYAYFVNAYKCRADYAQFTPDEIEDILSDYYIAATNPQFIEKIIDEYHSFPIFSIMSNIVDLHTMLSCKAVEEKGAKDFDACIRALPTHTLKQQVAFFGTDALRYIPKDTPRYNELVDIAGLLCVKKSSQTCSVMKTKTSCQEETIEME